MTYEEFWSSENIFGIFNSLTIRLAERVSCQPH
jgi:hypothetical protein